jgi:CheY-like chemotaxis protein
LRRLEEPVPLAQAGPDVGAHPSRKLKVLIVEDNVDSADTLRMALELGGGCEVTVAYTGPDGVEAARRVRPQLVLCDIGLPGCSGYEVARRIRAEANGSVVLVALTGYGRDEDREEAKAAGFNQHFTKPVDFAELNSVLRAVPERDVH